jgi:hypothetical protein
VLRESVVRATGVCLGHSPFVGTQCYGYAGKIIAVKCANAGYCGSTNPNGTANDNGIWTRTTVCN